MSETAWVIEASFMPPHYIEVRDLGCVEFHWTDDANKALRFARKQDAEAVLDLLFESTLPFRQLVCGPFPQPQARQHVWCDRVPELATAAP